MKEFSVSIQETSVTSILKFVTNLPITQNESFEFNNIDESQNSPLAQQLFYLPFVKKIFITTHFIAIECYDIVKWDDVKDEVAEQIDTYLNKNKGLVVATINSEKKLPVTVYAESTPNPSTLKFVANKRLVKATYEFISNDKAQWSPLAVYLFSFPYVKSVFLDSNYISITKHESFNWNEITSELRGIIKSYLQDGKPILNPNSSEDGLQQKSVQNTKYETLDDISKEIITILDEHVKPAVASDGGNIEFRSYNADSKVVKVALQGACSGCPSSTITLKNGIETLLKEMLTDKISGVEAINE